MYSGPGPYSRTPEAKAVDLVDSCDFKKRIVQLSAKTADDRSIAAYAVAAHEVGHAPQYARQDNDVEAVQEIRQWSRWILLAFIGVLRLWQPSYGNGGIWGKDVYLLLIIVPSLLLRFMTLGIEYNASLLTQSLRLRT